MTQEQKIIRAKVGLLDGLPLPGRLRHARRPHRQAAAVASGAVCPPTNPFGATPNPVRRVTGATANHVRIRQSRRNPVALMNDPGSIAASSNIPASEVIRPPSKAICTGLPAIAGKPGKIPVVSSLAGANSVVFG